MEIYSTCRQKILQRFGFNNGTILRGQSNKKLWSFVLADGDACILEVWLREGMYSALLNLLVIPQRFEGIKSPHR